MPNRFPKVLIALALLVASLAVQPALAEKILRRGNGAEPYSLDPHRAVMTAENHILGDMLVGLYTEDVWGKPVLGAAESAQTSKDGLTWTFKLRPHRWSDGTTVTAEDFVFAFRRVMARETAAEYASVLYPIKNALAVNKGKLAKEQLGVKAPDSRTFVIELEHPAPFLPQLLSHHTAFPVPHALVEKDGSDWTRANKMIVNGPYKLAEWRPHDHVRLVKNPLFFDASNVRIDEVVFYPTEDDAAALKRYRANELDTLERWPISEFKWLNTHIPAETKRTPQLAVYYVSFNMLRKPFNDIRVRKAVSLLMDTKSLANSVYQGVYGAAADSFIPPGTANVDRSAVLPWWNTPMPARVAEARQLLAAAGYGPNHPLKFTYRYISNPDIKRGAVALQAMWRSAGIDVELAAAEAKVHWNLLEVRDFEATYNTWQFDYNDAKNLFFTFQAAAVQMNNSAYDSAAFEDLLKRADAEPDLVARGRLLGEANARLIADLPAVPLMFPYQRHLVKGYVKGWNSNARDVNRSRWLDIGDKPATGDRADGGNNDGDGVFAWLGSWFSGDAWDKWWNS